MFRLRPWARIQTLGTLTPHPLYQSPIAHGENFQQKKPNIQVCGGILKRRQRLLCCEIYVQNVTSSIAHKPAEKLNAELPYNFISSNTGKNRNEVILPLIWASDPYKIYQLQGLLPWPTDQGLCRWTPLGAPSPYPLTGSRSRLPRSPCPSPRTSKPNSGYAQRCILLLLTMVLLFACGHVYRLISNRFKHWQLKAAT